MMTMDALRPGLSDAVLDSQSVFRTVMNAFARPGTIAEVDLTLDVPEPMTVASAALLLTLCDHDTPVFLGGAADAARWLAFHAGAPVLQSRENAAFIVMDAGDDLPDLNALRLGSDTFPDRSATVVIQCEALGATGPLRLKGPGIKAEAALLIDPLPDWFLATSKLNNSLFPRGVDWVFTAGTSLVALPRTTRIALAEDK